MFRNLTVIALLIISVSASYATNPADLTAFQRWSGPYYTAAREKGSWFACATYPIGSVSTTYFHWQDDEGKSTQDQVILVQSLNKRIDLALDADICKGGDLIHHQNVSIDWHTGYGEDGIGIMIPLQESEGIKLGVRKTLGQVTTFATLNEKSTPVYGVTLCQKWGKIDVAYGHEDWNMRISKSSKEWTQEARFNFAQNETTIGFRVAFCPCD